MTKQTAEWEEDYERVLKSEEGADLGPDLRAPVS